ncbi:hypothetical protein [Priestia sp. GS2]|uniref:hypothetical protein n=1 Tax=Priestia sp. GS2 TaxID=3117403 RepID=UPI002ED7777E
MKNKLLKIPVATLLVTSLLLPTTSFAAESTASDDENMISNPWDESTQTFPSTEDSLVEEAIIKPEEVVYDQSALELADEIKSDSAAAEQVEDIIAEEDVTFQDEVPLTMPPSNVMEGQEVMLQSTSLKAKSWYRDQFKKMSLYMGTVKLPTSGNFLYHSLQDKPSDRQYSNSSSLAKAFSLTKVYTSISVPMAEEIKKANKAGRKAVGAFNLSSSTNIANAGLDFYLTFGKFSYDWAAEKQSNGKWKVYIGIHDKYDYLTIKPIPKNFPDNYISLVNNHAANAQKAKAIVPYYIDVFREQTFTP